MESSKKQRNNIITLIILLTLSVSSIYIILPIYTPNSENFIEKLNNTRNSNENPTLLRTANGRTTINGYTGILFISQDIFIFEEINFTFDYRDVEGNTISDLNANNYFLTKLDDAGDPIPGTSETGSLIETLDTKYILDLNTESREEGEYYIIVSLNKFNYDSKIAIISLIIKKRIIQITWPDVFFDSKIEIDSDADLKFTITLTDHNDITVPNAPIIGANGYLTIKNENYSFTDNGDGTYSISIPKFANAFFLPQIFTALITIEKQYFSETRSTITVVVRMEEIFSFPLFYFLMIIGSIIAIVCSLAIYRIILQRRIPKFVKKTRQMKKHIKRKTIISESLLYPSKEEFIVNKFGDRWEMIGLSLEDVFDIETKKKKEIKFNGGIV